MEDTATCEISRTQIWQSIQHSRGVLEDGRKVTAGLFRRIMGEELDKIRSDVGPDTDDRGQYETARSIIDATATRTPLDEFLTLPAYGTSGLNRTSSAAVARGDRDTESPYIGGIVKCTLEC
jgi:malate synthase